MATLHLMRVAATLSVALTLGAGALRGQVAVELPRPDKEQVKVLAEVRVEWGLDPARESETEVILPVGDELSAGQTSYGPVTESLLDRMRQPMKLLDVERMDPEVVVAMKHETLAAEARVRQAVAALEQGEVGVLQARAVVRQVFREYLDYLEAID